MKKKKAAAYLTVIAALISLSIVTPLVIETISGHIAHRIRNKETETEKTSESVTEDGMTDISAEDESESLSSPPGSVKKAASSNEPGKKSGSEGDTVIVDSNYYEEPFYESREQEDAANKKAYEDMEGRLSTLSEAAGTYRKNFNPVYDELINGLMNAFISGREQVFYDDIADYCFGHYNTSYQIRAVRFDALLEDTPEKTTVILEFFTQEDLEDDRRIPDLKLCTYNKKTEAFTFFQGAGR